jgi:ABC-type multidrug transport system fused ATPase/permease subunit
MKEPSVLTDRHKRHQFTVLRGLMGLVTQDSILFNDTIKANISLGQQNATDDEIIEALKYTL